MKHHAWIWLALLCGGDLSEAQTATPLRGAELRAADIATAERPNVVLIMADDLGHVNLSAYGAKNFSTPNIDRLAETGTRFDHCYSLPLCTPSRIALMTGQHNGRNHVLASTLDRNQRTFGHLAKDAGYATCVVGKWKLSGKDKDSRPSGFGFAEYCVTEGTRNDSPRYKNPEILQNGKVTKYANGEYGPDIIRDYALGFIERHKDKPFFLYYPMVQVHTPLSPVPGTPGYAAADQHTDDQANYKDMVGRMDADVGLVITNLEKLGLRERTIVIFTGDNGTKKSVTIELQDGVRYPGGKGNTSDNGVHVPLIVSQPGRVPAGTRSDLVDFTDFMPTIAEIIGAKLPEQVPCDGVSFMAPCLGRENTNARKSIYQWFCNNPAVDKPVESVFNREYRLYADGRLFDIKADRAESRPLDAAKLTDDQRRARDELQKALKVSQAGFKRPAAK
jgi:arylsulfatase A